MINKEMTIMDAIQQFPETVSVLQSYNLGCLGCIAASGETLEQGLNAHGLNVEEVVGAMNAAVSKKEA